MAGKSGRGRDGMVKSGDDVRTNEEQLLNAPYGQQGAVVFTTEGLKVNGDFYCIMALRDDVVLQALFTEVNWDTQDLSTSPSNPGQGSVSWSGKPATFDIPLPVGMPFYGDFASIILKDQSAIDGHCDNCPKLIAYYK